jgi:hypothetical protein
LHPRTDLGLLLQSLVDLSRTPYFNRELEEHTLALIDVVEHVLSASPRYDDEIVRQLVDRIWLTHRYLQGSTTKESPYEIEYCLRFAISEWLPFSCIVTTALTDEKDFHLKIGDPWDFVRTTIDRYKNEIPESRLIFIGVPRLYKSMPLFCCALYHELGHFVDQIGEITETTLLLAPIDDKAPRNLHQFMISYRREHFADLFAACYVGAAIGDSLMAINPDAGLSLSHPSTRQRVDLIAAFLADEECEEVNFFQDALKRRGFPALEKRFSMPDIQGAYDDIRPHTLNSSAELHGIFPAAWAYLNDALEAATPTWTKGANFLEINKIINDLTEKSIRNSSIRQLWSRSHDA